MRPAGVRQEFARKPSPGSDWSQIRPQTPSARGRGAAPLAHRDSGPQGSATVAVAGATRAVIRLLA